jgi:hypothetical protein
MKKELVWKVYADNFKEIKQYNIFSHTRFAEDVKKDYKKYKDNFEEFKERLKRNLQYYFWSKCEWEIVLKPWVGRAEEIKIDVYDQVYANFDVFTDYVWNFYTSRRRKKKVMGEDNDTKAT